MSAPVAIAASLVNMRNVGTHKSVALTVHVPEEQAAVVIEAFGWPTMTTPVPVAIARLDLRSEAEADIPASAPALPREKTAWADKLPSQQAGMRCGEPAFGMFLAERYTDVLRRRGTVRDTVCELCGVTSRRDLNTNHKARMLWFGLDAEYLQATGRMAVAHG